MQLLSRQFPLFMFFLYPVSYRIISIISLVTFREFSGILVAHWIRNMEVPGLKPVADTLITA